MNHWYGKWLVLTSRDGEKVLIEGKIQLTYVVCLMNKNSFLYILGDPYCRVSACKIGITQRLEERLFCLFGNGRRHVYLPDGMAVFSLYSVPDWKQAAELERALLRVFHDHKADTRTLGWLALKPVKIDLVVDLLAEHLGIECEQCNFPYFRWNDDKHPRRYNPLERSFKAIEQDEKRD